MPLHLWPHHLTSWLIWARSGDISRNGDHGAHGGIPYPGSASSNAIVSAVSHAASCLMYPSMPQGARDYSYALERQWTIGMGAARPPWFIFIILTLSFKGWGYAGAGKEGRVGQDGELLTAGYILLSPCHAL